MQSSDNESELGSSKINDNIESDLTNNQSSNIESNSSNNKSIYLKKSTYNMMLLGIIGVVAIAAFFAGSYTSVITSDQVSKEDIENVVAKFELKMLENQLPTAPPSPQPVQLPTEPPSPDTVKVSLDDDPIIGDPNAPISIVEFSDFQCPFCARFHTQTLPSLLDDYIAKGQVKLVFRDFPLQSIHPNAMSASLAAECANDQDKFKDMHDILFDNQGQWSSQPTAGAVSLFIDYAEQINLNKDTFDTCLNDKKHESEIRNDLNHGRDYGVTGTPAFFIGNDELGFERLSGAQPFDSFSRVIDRQLGNSG